MTIRSKPEYLLAEQLRRAEQERDRLRLAISRALAHLPGRPEAAETILERALEETKR